MSETGSRDRGKVLVLGEDARAFLTVIRSLGRKGIEVHVAWCPQDALALRSKYIRRIHNLPAYSTNDDAWKRELISLCRTERFDLVIPCNDQTLIPLQTHRDELRAVGRFYTLPPRAFDIAFNKIKTNQLGRELGLKLPREAIASQSSDGDAIARDFRFPVVLKPEASFKAQDLHSRHDVERVNDAESLRQHLPRMLSGGTRVIVQEVFNGVGAGVELIARDGKILVAFQHVRVHEPLTGGASSYRKSVPLDPQLLDAAEKLVAALGYTGVAMIEFRINPQTGDWILIEINGRFWGSLPLAVAAGADFPFYLYEMLVHGRTDFPTSYQPETYCRNLSQEINWLMANWRADKRDPTLRTLPWSSVAGESLNVLRLREHSDTFVLDDPAPGAAEIARIADIATRRARDAAARIFRSLPPVRRWHRARLQRRLRQARSILFVCHGNICRSPFAELYARQALSAGGGAMVIRSSGYFPRSGRTSPDAAIAAAAEFGVALGSHRSSVLSQKLIDDAGVIFVFDQDNYRQLARRYPWAAERTFFLGIAGDGPTEISDPYGQSVEHFRECYRSIARRIDAVTDAFRPEGWAGIEKSTLSQHTP